MSRVSKYAAVMGMGIALVSCAFAQAPDAQLAVAPVAAASTIPLDQQPTDEQLDKLFEVMHVREQMASMTKMLPSLIQNQVKNQFKQTQKDRPESNPLKAEQQDASAKMLTKYIERVMTLYPYEEMVSDMKTIYKRHLTKSDVDGITAFYSSQAGQHFIETLPVIMKEYTPLAMRKTQERLKPLLDEITKEMGTNKSSGVVGGTVTTPPPPPPAK